jgi:hypothetical protein
LKRWLLAFCQLWHGEPALEDHAIEGNVFAERNHLEGGFITKQRVAKPGFIAENYNL